MVTSEACIDITAVILAGGRARRFGGQDKGLIHYKSCPIIQHVIQAITPQVETVMINANRNQEQYAKFEYPVINDELSGFQGPLAGFSTAMEHATTAYILTLPCDGPIIGQDYAARMAKTMADKQVDLVVAHDGRRMQPVHTLISVGLRDSLNAYLESGERKIDRWFTQHDIALADFSDSPEIFENINSKEELDMLEMANE